jgi:hypothetical protein
MANSIDFRADQVQTSKIIVTGSAPEKTLLIYGIDADDSPPNQGNINPALFNTSSIGSDVFMFVSGTVGGRGGAVPSIVAFGGDLHISGNLTVDGTYPSGGGGTNYFTEVALNSIATTGSVAMTLLSASTGARITGSITQGAGNTASGINSFARGVTSVASGQYAFAEGYGGCLASGDFSHAEGYSTEASGQASHSEGIGGTASGLYSHNEGGYSQARQNGSHSEGYYTNANAVYSHTEGVYTGTTGPYSHAEGGYSAASGTAAHAEGNGTAASGNYSHSEGTSTIASGQYAHAEGDSTQANGIGSHAEGYLAKANGIASHAEGINTNAFGTGSLAAGLGTIASGAIDGVSPQTTIQAAFGKYNLGNNTESLFVIGDGLDGSNRHDVFRVNSGSVQVTGSLEVLGGITGSISGTVASNPFIVGGANITTNYNSLGQWELTGSGGGFTAADLVALTQATNTELNDDSLAYVVIDPSGTPTSRKSTLARLGLPPKYIANQVLQLATPTITTADSSTGQYFLASRVNQQCTGVRVYWAGGSVVTLKLSLWQDGVPGGALASGTVTTTGAAGFYSVTFGSPVSLTRTIAYIATCYEQTGTVAMAPSSMGPIGSYYHLNPSFGGFLLMDYNMTTWAYAATGDALPGTITGGFLYPIDPLISG